MIINVRTIPKSSEDEVTHIFNDEYRVKLTTASDKRKANNHLIKLLAAYFDTNKSSIRILNGFKSRDKKIDIT